MSYMTVVDTRILTYLRAPGRQPPTAREIAIGIYGENANANAVQSVLKAMITEGRLTRTGTGKKNDPYRYEVAE